MSASPDVISLNVIIGEHTYSPGWLSFNSRKRECSYHFHFSSSVNSAPYSFDINQKASPLDHITWHQQQGRKKPVVHMKVKNKEVLDSVYYRYSGGIQCDLMECFYLNGSTEHNMLRLTHTNKKQNSRCVGKIDGDFGLAFIWEPHSRDIFQEPINPHGTNLLFSPDQIFSGVIKIDIFENLSLWICLIPFVFICDAKITGCYRAISYEQPHSSLSQIIKDNFDLTKV